MTHTQNSPEPTLPEVRRNIDALDEHIVSLIAQRQNWVSIAGTLKTDELSVRAPDRVEQVISKVRALAQAKGASPDVVELTYRALISAFIDLELQQTGHHQASDSQKTKPAQTRRSGPADCA